MAIVVQRDFYVDPANHVEFERLSREGVWEAFRRFGAQPFPFGTWVFGGRSDVLTLHTAYADFEHWQATRVDGAQRRDPEMLQETAEFLEIARQRGALVRYARARVFDLVDEVSWQTPFYRKPGEALSDLPQTYGRGSVVAEETYRLTPGSEGEFVELSRDHVWPWLAERGGRHIAFGNEPLGPANEVWSLTAYRSLAEWQAHTGPSAAGFSGPVAEAYARLNELIEERHGRLMTVGTDFGEPIE